MSHPRSRLAISFARQLVVNDVLDLGCGDGEVAVELARLTGAKVIAADVSNVALDACRRRGLQTARLQAGEPLPFAENSFDLVFMTEVIEHLLDPSRTLNEIRRVLRPNGYLILSTPNLACLPNRFLVLLGIQPLFSEVSEEGVYGRRFKMFGQGGEPVGHLRLYTRGALKEVLEASEFKLLIMRGAAFHESGLTSLVERALTFVPGLAMILVVLAQRDG
jgi:ubiquinone/menaquinone biosynthesis C-methylase UbiE